MLQFHIFIKKIHAFATARKNGSKYNNMIELSSSLSMASTMMRAPRRKGLNMCQAIRGRVTSQVYGALWQLLAITDTWF